MNVPNLNHFGVWNEYGTLLTGLFPTEAEALHDWEMLFSQTPGPLRKWEEGGQNLGCRIGQIKVVYK